MPSAPVSSPTARRSKAAITRIEMHHARTSTAGPGLSTGEAVADHGQWGRLERKPVPSVEGGVAAAGRRERLPPCRVPLSAGDEQVEHDGAPDVLPHHGALAWSAVGEP